MLSNQAGSKCGLWLLVIVNEDETIILCCLNTLQSTMHGMFVYACATMAFLPSRHMVTRSGSLRRVSSLTSRYRNLDTSSRRPSCHSSELRTRKLKYHMLLGLRKSTRTLIVHWPIINTSGTASFGSKDNCVCCDVWETLSLSLA